MPTIKDFGSFKITMYFGDHNPPHVHLISAGQAAQMSIQTQKLMNGSIPTAIERVAAKWVAENQDMLMAKWAELQEE